MTQRILNSLRNHGLNSGIGSVRLASAIIRGGHTLGMHTNNYCKHAEKMAIDHICSNLLNNVKNIHKYRKMYDIMVIRIRSNGDLANARPCIDCLKYMQSINLKGIYYSNESGQIVYERLSTMKSDFKSSGQRYFK